MGYLKKYVMASLESFTRETSNHSNHPRLASYTARVRLGESGQLDRQCLTSLTTLNASTNESVSGEYAAIKEGTSTSAVLQFIVQLTWLIIT